jgi:hypothetical protein
MTDMWKKPNVMCQHAKVDIKTNDKSNFFLVFFFLHMIKKGVYV